MGILSSTVSAILALLSTATYIFLQFCLLLKSSLYRAIMRQTMKTIPPSDLDLHVLAALERGCANLEDVELSEDLLKHAEQSLRSLRDGCGGFRFCLR